MQAKREFALVSTEWPALLASHPGSGFVLADGGKPLGDFMLAQRVVVSSLVEYSSEVIFLAKLNTAWTVATDMSEQSNRIVGTDFEFESDCAPLSLAIGE